MKPEPEPTPPAPQKPFTMLTAIGTATSNTLPPRDEHPAHDRHEASRAAFEKINVSSLVLNKRHELAGDPYRSQIAQWCWESWCAALDYAAQQETQPAATTGSAREWLERDDREWPLPIHAQRIIFEGCDAVTMPPDAYLALYNDALVLAQRVDQHDTWIRILEGRLANLRAQLTATQARITELEVVLGQLHDAALGKVHPSKMSPVIKALNPNTNETK